MDRETQNPLSSGPVSLPVPSGPDRPIIPIGQMNPPSQGDPNSRDAAIPSTASSDYHPKFTEEVHQYVREYIRNADQKAAFFFTVSTALFVFLKNEGALSQWMQSPLKWTCMSLLAFASTVGLTLCAGISLFVVFPRRLGSKRGVIFFDAIVEHESSREYAENILRHSTIELLKAKLSHCYELAKVCRQKYDLLHFAFWALAIGTGATVLYLVFFLSNP